MKFAIVLCCFLAAASATNIKINGVVGDIVKSQERAFETELLAAVEKVRDIIINGDPENGIPVLDPFNKESADLELNIPETANIVANLLGVKMVGLKDFVVNKLSINLLRFRLDYDFSLDVLDMSADNYDMDGNIIDFHLFGNGPARIGLRKMRVSGYTSVSMSQMQMKEFKLIIELGEFQSEIDGLLGGGESSDFINEVLSTLIPSVLEEKQKEITAFIEEKVLEVVNGMLSGSSKADFNDILKSDRRQIGAFMKKVLNL